MPSDKYTEAMKEAYASSPTDVFILNTLEITQRNFQGGGLASKPFLDVCFTFDTTGSMASYLSTAQAIVQDIVDQFEEDFTTVRYSLVTFKDEDETEIALGFTENSQALIDAVNALTVSGGGDGPENGFGAAVLAAGQSWSVSSNTAKAIICITDQTSHERGATEQEAIDTLTGKEIVFILGSDGGQQNYGPLIEATGGGDLDFTQDSEDVLSDLLDIMDQVASYDGFFLVQAVDEYDLTLEDLTIQTFEPVGFNFKLPGQNDQGIQELTIEIDNVDRRIGDFLRTIALTDVGTIIKYRPYLSSDLTTPQLDPPLEMVLSDLKITETKVIARASFADIINLEFLTRLYTRREFPSLGNS